MNVINRKGWSRMNEPMPEGKSHFISKQVVWDAWLKVKENGGAAGADGVTMRQFEERVKDNLYKLWNRMSSGSYFPGPVRAVEIPKKGGTRVLGIPNIVDRVAQTVAVMTLEPEVEKVFHDDSYGQWPCVRESDDVRHGDEQAKCDAHCDVHHKIMLYRPLKQGHWATAGDEGPR